MASVFAHALSGYALGSLFKKIPPKLMILGILCTILPDADIISFYFGIPYEHPLGHRGFSHSILFAILLALLIRIVYYRKYKWKSRESFIIITFLFLCCGFHGILDAITNGGRGVGFFIPFDNGRYFLPWRPVQVSPIGASKFFSEWGLKVIVSEAIFIGIPFTLMIIFSRLFYLKDR